MAKRTGIITFQGNGLTLDGNVVNVGDTAPDFTAVKNDLSPCSLNELKGKTVVIVAVPSLDTPVCDIEAQRFNKEAAKLGEDVVVVVISMDLPFAQARWCGNQDANNAITVSDYKDADFGTKYGQLVAELRLLARSIFVIDPAGKITYIQQVAELTKEPDYEQALAAIKEVR